LFRLIYQLKLQEDDVNNGTHKAYRKVTKSGLAVAALVAGALLGGGTALAAPTNVLETGSSLLYPLFNLWVPAYHKVDANVKITTQSTGSGTGISQAISGVAQIGASDAYLSNALMMAHKGMLNIPLSISSQMVNYNVPGLNQDHLKLSGPVLAAIYEGKVGYWDNAAIKKLNPGVNLPHKAIVPVHRTDGSGDTFIFTQYLTFSAPAWKKIGYGTTVSWPAVQGGIGAVGNPGMVNAIKTTPYSVAYIGVSFRNSIQENKLGEAKLGNKAGKFVLITPATVSSAVKAMASKTPADERISLIFAPGAESYPIVNYEYAIVKAKQPSREMAETLKKFFTWAMSTKGGNSPHFMEQVGFVPLPNAIQELSKKQIEKIHH
jgi:phosphate transport system substrate-binding protein